MSANLSSPLGNLTFLLQNNASSIAVGFRLPTLLKISSYCGFFIVVAAVIDLEILLTFYRRRRRLITPFTVHIVNLTVINFITTTLYTPLFFQRNISREIFRGNRSLCSLCKYLQWTSIGLIELQHGVICLDRWLAVLFPIWYRSKTVRFGQTATLIAFVYIHLWYLPLLVRDAMIPVAPSSFCDLTQALPGYQIIVRVTTSYLPQLFIFVSYPILLLKIHRRKRATDTAQPAEIDRVGPRRKVKNAELRLSLTLVVLQIIFWGPQSILAVLVTMRAPVPYLYDAAATILIFGQFLLLVDPLINLLFLRQLREEVMSHLLGVCTGRQIAVPAFGSSLTSKKVEDPAVRLSRKIHPL